MDDRLMVNLSLTVTDNKGNVTAGATFLQGQMKLKDAMDVEAVLLQEIPRIYLGMLNQRRALLNQPVQGQPVK